jgi:hypothetical protein
MVDAKCRAWTRQRLPTFEAVVLISLPMMSLTLSQAACWMTVAADDQILSSRHYTP